jgi:hypothetical protein
MDLIVAKVSDVPARQVLVVFDSCFSGAVFAVRSSTSLATSDTKPLVNLPVREFITAGNEHEKIPAHSPIPQLLLNAVAGEADIYHAGFVTAQEIQMYLWAKTREAKFGITPEVGKQPGGVFDRGEFVFPVISPEPPVASPAADATSAGICADSDRTESSEAYIVSDTANLRLTSCVAKLGNYYSYSYEVKNMSAVDVRIAWDDARIVGWLLRNGSLRIKMPSSRPPEQRPTQSIRQPRYYSNSNPNCAVG